MHSRIWRHMSQKLCNLQKCTWLIYITVSTGPNVLKGQSRHCTHKQNNVGVIAMDNHLTGSHLSWHYSPPQSSNTMYCNATAWFLLKFTFQEVQPVINNLFRRRTAIIKRPILEKKKKHNCCSKTTAIINMKNNLKLILGFNSNSYQNFNAFFFHWSLVISRFTNPNKRLHSKTL